MLIERGIPWLSKVDRKLQKSQRKSDLDVVLSAFRSFRLAEPVGYLSTPITTGILFYRVLEKYGVKTLEELLAKGNHLLFEEIIKPNTDSGIALGDELTAKWKLPIIVPAVFEARSQRWTQDDYMYIWYQVITEMVDHMILGDHWQYSNGGVGEFVHSMEKRFRLWSVPSADDILPSYFSSYLPWSAFEKEFPKKFMKITDERGQDVGLEDGVVLISEAIGDLYRRGFRARKLLSLLMQLVGIAQAVSDYLQDREYRRGLNLACKIDMPLIDRYWCQILAVSQEGFREIKALCYD